MDDPLKNLLSLIPIALFIAYRIIMARRKQAEARKKQDETPPGEEAFQEEARPVTVAAASQEDDEEPVFSAWDLSANDPPPPEPEPPQVTPPPETMAILPSFAEPEVFIPEDTEPAPLGIADVSSSVPSFPDNLAYLPPLKRALVLSEILGPPRGQIV